MCILVVDDDSGVVQSFARWLTALGWRVWTAGDGQTALSILTSERELTGVVVELGLRDMDGEQLVYTMRQARPDIAIVVMTHPPRVPSRAWLEGLRVHRCLVKPFSGNDLATALTDALGPSRA